MSERARAVYVISVVAEFAGVHPPTLRNYERTGLLSPQRTAGGSRRFSDEDLATLRRIQELTTEGVNLEGVKRILALEHEVAHLRAERDALLDARDAAVREAHRQYRRDLVPVQNAIALFVDATRQNRGAR